jgi:hypothetical protein
MEQLWKRRQPADANVAQISRDISRILACFMSIVCPPPLVSREKAWALTKKPLPHSSVHAQDVCYKKGDIDVLHSSRFAPLWVSEDKPTFINMSGDCLPREQTFPVHAYMPFPHRSRPQSPVPHASAPSFPHFQKPVPHASDATAPCFPKSQANPRPEPVDAV